MTKQANPILIRFHCFEEDLAEDCQEAVTQKPQTERLREREREREGKRKWKGSQLSTKPFVWRFEHVRAVFGGS